MQHVKSEVNIAVDFDVVSVRIVK